jgi:selenide, water dikinase
MAPFDPVAVGLPPTFRLLSYSKLKGCSCKVPRAELLTLLAGLGDGHIGMDSSVMPTRVPGVSLVQTTDFFYPVVEDPYMQGRIAAANVLSDLYAMGVTHCDNMLMLLSTCLDMAPHEADVRRRRKAPPPVVVHTDRRGHVSTCVDGGGDR